MGRCAGLRHRYVATAPGDSNSPRCGYRASRRLYPADIAVPEAPFIPAVWHRWAENGVLEDRFLDVVVERSFRQDLS